MITTRRQFLHLTASAFVTAPTFSSLYAAESAPAKSAKPRPLGFSLYGMKSLPQLDALDHLARIGYRHVEFCAIPGFPSEPAIFSAESRRAVRQRLHDHGMTPCAVMLSLNLAGDARAHTLNLEKIKAAGELARQLDEKNPPVIETVMGGKPEAWDTTKSELAARLRAWGEAAAANGITLCAKGHADNAVNTPERLLWILQQSDHPNLAANYDYSHYQYEGRDLEGSLRQLRPYIRFIAMKDVIIGQKPARFLLTGESGQIDYAHYFRLLDELKYTGPTVVEVSSQISGKPGYDPVQAAAKTFANLSAALAQR